MIGNLVAGKTKIAKQITVKMLREVTSTNECVMQHFSWRFIWILELTITFAVAKLIWPTYINVTPDRQTDNIPWRYPRIILLHARPG